MTIPPTGGVSVRQPLTAFLEHGRTAQHLIGLFGVPEPLVSQLTGPVGLIAVSGTVCTRPRKEAYLSPLKHLF